MSEAENKTADEPKESPAFDLDDRIGMLRRNLETYKSTSEEDLSEARSSRARAESALEQAEAAIENAHTMNERMRADLERRVEEANGQRLEAEKARQDAEAELARVRESMAQAEQERQRVIADTHSEALGILHNTRAVGYATRGNPEQALADADRALELRQGQLFCP